MNPILFDEMMRKLSQLVVESPDMRFGQLVSTLNFLAEDIAGRSAWDVDDEEYLAAIDKHLADLSFRKQHVA